VTITEICWLIKDNVDSLDKIVLYASCRTDELSKEKSYTQGHNSLTVSFEVIK
jgi:hypothetical protein